MTEEAPMMKEILMMPAGAVGNARDDPDLCLMPPW
jgi:hypothetical protein